MTLAERYQATRDQIALAAAKSGRQSSDVTLIVITKNHPAQLVFELAQLGHRDFGENRDQEARPKALTVAADLGQAVNWHFVGQLQSNKVKAMLEYTSVLHSLDRPSLLRELAKRLAASEKSLDCFIELNLTDDEARGGVTPTKLLEFAEHVLATPGIRLRGLMGVAGLGVDPRSDFEKVLKARDELLTLEPQANQLSMGMSADFVAAIELGATHVRIGTAITGSRPYLT